MKKIALLIGINDYRILGDLHFACQDAQTMGETLQSRCGFSSSEVIVMTDDSDGALYPTTRYIERQLDAIRSIKNLDLFVFGFWGHGFASSAQNRYLCGQDAMEDDLESTALSFGRLLSVSRQIGAQNTLILLDCCRNSYIGRSGATGLLTGESLAWTNQLNASRDIGLKQSRFESVRPDKVTAIFNSCSEGQKSYEWDMRQHGVFSALFLDALDSGINSVTRIKNQITPQMESVTQRLFGFRAQRPCLTIDGGCDLYLPLSARRPAEKAPPVNNPPKRPAENRTTSAAPNSAPQRPRPAENRPTESSAATPLHTPAAGPAAPAELNLQTVNSTFLFFFLILCSFSCVIWLDRPANRNIDLSENRIDESTVFETPVSVELVPPKKLPPWVSEILNPNEITFDSSQTVCKSLQFAKPVKGQGVMEHTARGVSFSPDGVTFISWNSAKRLDVWNAIDGANRFHFELEDVPYGAYFTQDSRYVLVLHEDGISVYDCLEEKKLKSILWSEPDLAVFPQSVQDVMSMLIKCKERLFNEFDSWLLAQIWDKCSFSLSRQRILTNDSKIEKGLVLWDSQLPKMITRFRDNYSYNNYGVLSPDGKMFVCENYNKEIGIFNAFTGEKQVEIDAGKYRFSKKFRFSYDSRYLLIVDSGALDEKDENGHSIYINSISILDAQTGREVYSSKPGDIDSASISPDNKYVVYSLGKQLILDDIQTGKTVWPQRRNVKNLGVTPQGRAFLSRESQVEILNSNKTENEIASLENSAGTEVLCYSSDGKRYAGLINGAPVFWNAQTGKREKAQTGSLPENVCGVCCAFNPADSNELALGGSNGAVYIYNLESNKITTLEKRHKGTVLCLAWSPDGQNILSGGNDKIACVTNVKTRKIVYRCAEHEHSVSCIAVSPDGGFFATCYNNYCVVWNAQTGKSLYSIDNKSGAITAAAFSPFAAMVLTDSSGTATVYDTSDGKIINSCKFNTDINTITFSEDGKKIYCAGLTQSDFNVFQVFISETGQLEKEQQEDYFSVAVSKDEAFIAAAEGNDIILWNPVSGQIEKRLSKHAADVVALVWSQTALELRSVDKDNKIMIWDVKTGECTKTIYEQEPYLESQLHLSKPLCIACGLENRATAVGFSKGEIYTKVNNITCWENKNQGAILSLDWNSSASILAAAGENNVITLWDGLFCDDYAKEGEFTRYLKSLIDHSGAVTAVKFSPVDDNLLASAGKDNTIRFWNVEQGECVKTIRLEEPDEIQSLTYNPDGKSVFSGDSAGVIKQWDAESGKMIKSYSVHKGAVKMIYITADGSRMVSSGADRVIKITTLK